MAHLCLCRRRAADGAEPASEQKSTFDLASIGLGSRVRLFDHLSGSIDAGLPLIRQSRTQTHDLLLTFRVWADF